MTGFPASPFGAFTIAHADVDGDGDVDVYVCYSNITSSYAHALYLGDGQGGFTQASSFPTQLPEAIDSVFGDFDGDGDQDLVLAAGKGVYLENDGKGGFTDATATRLPPSSVDSWVVESADLDGDNDLDLVMGELGFFGSGGLFCLRNDGTGKFTRAVQLFSSAIAKVQVGDINGDKRPDIFAQTPILNKPYLFIATGAFAWADQTATNWPTVPSDATASELADWDKDGDLDFVYTPSGSAAKPAVCLNDGKGVFSATISMSNVTLRKPVGIAVFDADEDGDVDVVFGEWDGDAQLILQLSKSSVSNPVALGVGKINQLHCADVDQDGDVDLVLDHAIAPSPIKYELVLMLNHQRQVHAATDPMIGATWQLDSWSLAPTARYVVNFLSLDKLAKRVATPLGFLGLDPAKSVALLPIVMDSTATKATQMLAIPNTTSLRGLGLHCQGLVIPRNAPAASKLTNVWSMTIR
ncbi:MAG: VCBS repeat-containing protein [Planctomycetes bacterium]|nr:VCBS repeat-containing protein [Planctomycetota bacterium]